MSPGQYRVAVDEQKYAAEWFPDRDTAQDGTDVEVQEGLTTPGIDMTLDPLSRISGRVTSSDGSPLAGVTISMGVLSRSTTSAQDGTYEFRVQPGEYVLNFFDGSKYLPQWWWRGSSEEEAEPIVAARRATVPGINAQLTRTSTISGRIADQGGRGLATTVTAYRMDGSKPTVGGGSEVSNNEGIYTIEGLRPGRFILRAGAEVPPGSHVPTYWPNTVDPREARLITVGVEGDVTGIDLALPQAPVVTGRIVGTADGSYTDVFAERRENGRWRVGAAQQVTADGAFRLQGLRAGVYRFRFFHRADGAPWNQWWSGAYRAEDAKVVRLGPGQRLTGVDARVGAAPRPLKVRSRPLIRGSVRTGQRVRVAKDRYNARRVSRDYEWRVGSRLIKRAQGRNLRVTRGMVGRRIQVRVTARKPGRIPVETRSKRSKQVRR